jgi:hypothetical protein
MTQNFGFVFRKKHGLARRKRDVAEGPDVARLVDAAQPLPEV